MMNLSYFYIMCMVKFSSLNTPNKQISYGVSVSDALPPSRISILKEQLNYDNHHGFSDTYCTRPFSHLNGFAACFVCFILYEFSLLLNELLFLRGLATWTNGWLLFFNLPLFKWKRIRRFLWQDNIRRHCFSFIFNSIGQDIRRVSPSLCHNFSWICPNMQIISDFIISLPIEEMLHCKNSNT